MPSGVGTLFAGGGARSPKSRRERCRQLECRRSWQSDKGTLSRINSRSRWFVVVRRSSSRQMGRRATGGQRFISFAAGLIAMHLHRLGIGWGVLFRSSPARGEHCLILKRLFPTAGPAKEASTPPTTRPLISRSRHCTPQPHPPTAIYLSPTLAPKPPVQPAPANREQTRLSHTSGKTGSQKRADDDSPAA
jgi:hypothetical protein